MYISKWSETDEPSKQETGNKNCQTNTIQSQTQVGWITGNLKDLQLFYQGRIRTSYVSFPGSFTDFGTYDDLGYIWYDTKKDMYVWMFLN